MTTNTNNKKSNRGKRQAREITVTYINELPAGVFEKTLANIYAKKINNGTLKIN